MRFVFFAECHSSLAPEPEQTYIFFCQPIANGLSSSGLTLVGLSHLHRPSKKSGPSKRSRAQPWQKRFLTTPNDVDIHSTSLLREKQLQGATRVVQNEFRNLCALQTFKQLLGQPYHRVYDKCSPFIAVGRVVVQLMFMTQPCSHSCLSIVH